MVDYEALALGKFVKLQDLQTVKLHSSLSDDLPEEIVNLLPEVEAIKTDPTKTWAQLWKTREYSSSEGVGIRSNPELLMDYITAAPGNHMAYKIAALWCYASHELAAGFLRPTFNKHLLLGSHDSSALCMAVKIYNSLRMAGFPCNPVYNPIKSFTSLDDFVKNRSICLSIYDVTHVTLEVLDKIRAFLKSESDQMIVERGPVILCGYSMINTGHKGLATFIVNKEDV